MKTREQELLGRARRAEQEALKVKDERLRDLWTEIAAGYRAMAAYLKAGAITDR